MALEVLVGIRIASVSVLVVVRVVLSLHRESSNEVGFRLARDGVAVQVDELFVSLSLPACTNGVGAGWRLGCLGTPVLVVEVVPVVVVALESI